MYNNTPKWSYLSDDRPIENLRINEKCSHYNDSDLIEANFQISRLIYLQKNKENPYEIFSLN